MAPLRPLLALSALAALALVAVPSASATLANPICTPDTALQACVRVDLPPSPTDLYPSDVCAIAGSAHESVFACVYLLPSTDRLNLCVHVITSLASLSPLACIPH